MARIRSTKLLNMRDKSWYSITNKADGPAQVHIYDEIGYVGVSAGQFATDLQAVNGDLEVHLNSPGGEVFDGIAIYNTLKPRNPTIVVDSLAASIASVIAMAAAPGKLLMAKNAQMMIHDGFGMTVGNAADMREMADLLDKASDNIASIYSDRTGQPVDQWRDAMKKETWYTAQEAVKAGLADRIQGDTLSNEFDLSIFSNSKTSSDGAESSGKPAKKKNKKIAADGVDNSPWDAGRAWHNGASSDDPAAFYKAICAGRKSGDPSKQGSWALPYRYTPSSAPNAAGVRNALARIDQTQGLTNHDEAKVKLQRLMKQVNPDYEPDNRLAEFIFALQALEEA